MGWFKRLPNVVKDLIIFNSFIFMMQFILNYGLGKNFVIRGNALMAANTGLLIVYLFRYRVDKIRAEEKSKKKESK